MITLHDSPDSAERFAQIRAREEPQRIRDPGRVAPIGHRARGALASTIGNYPLVAFGAAVLAGIAVGWWIKRR
jgi:hypothetical protein